MLYCQRKLLHSFFSTQKTNHPVIQYINSQVGDLQQKDNQILNVYPSTSLRQIYDSYMKHCKLKILIFIKELIYKQNKQGLRDADLKLQGIKDAYIRILKDRLKNEIKVSEQKDYEFLLSVNFGLEFQKTEMRSEMIADLIDDHKSSQTIWAYPRAVLFTIFILTGIPSFFLHN